ncbi:MULTISPECIES: tRNA lysidine(34) synthetase TilS [unclassified Pseudomonas]|uniref:tRNA lysidine(34) synthetase TilS n=1 Tax=unclassified Pseudomonas TaxID=196821 RepID=UPI000BD2545B|nr:MULTISPECIES: tRNA lysidine(34) synthetase TilS [unclassified Pseudomonas]PVZ20747.1 tRNA(Ile)-lysidine synthase [Pseudomonas sp. URIL14HWK12:I12]PVZ27813.1 tRNA(Ile)-lysidine synthase [Pseudomonas sp. URIL14HWK12:I10]PVZ38702.1 tRNA(Ile)-lysidine synthase [Pseudomonas sp. URIL14HWK12:I11]SNZ02317.1 tRNA(Ile)-lysidine synthase [Pseudomonas sp. URIL14HWK12:I9]
MNLADALLETLAPWRSAPGWVVGFSGGLDSTVLLHLLSGLACQHALPPLRAVHVHHGLQTVANAWPAHCERLCHGLGVPLCVVPVQVASGASLEAQARQARHQAFASELSEGEVLLLGHHRDDQAETVLFRLLRGAGAKGLSGMSRQRPLGAGTLLRPLLELSRRDLEAYARVHRLEWVEDPTNAQTDADRNFLRHRILPELTQRWPAAQARIAQAAGHLAEANELLGELAAQDLADATPSAFTWLGLPSLALAPLQALSPARQRNALRRFLEPLTRLPDARHWKGWEDLRDARLAGEPAWRLEGGELRRSGDHLWWLAEPWLSAVPLASVHWLAPHQPLSLPGNGQVMLAQVPAGALQVRYRRGGEVLTLPGRGRRDLKRWLQERGVPAFARSRWPLLFADEQLVAVAEFALEAGQGPLLRWRPPTNAQCL